jgi:ParB family chromosome partitioning protein
MAAYLQLRSVPPGDLVIGGNVRVDARIDKDFTASIRERGVLEPIIATENTAGQLIVLRGKRRTLTAVEVGLSLVPVVVVATPEEADRLVDQIAENDHRTGITQQERVNAYEQLAGFGLSAAQIAKRTARPRAEVSAGLKTATSKAALAAMAKQPAMTLEQAGVIAEFEDDKDAVKDLVDAVRYGGFQHRAQYLRDRRVETAARDKVRSELVAAGVRVIETPGFRDKPKELSGLHLGSGTADVVAGRHAACPGHAAYINSNWSGRDRVYAAEYVCTDPEQYGHKLRQGSYGVDVATTAGGEKSEADREAARAERRDVIDSNRAWVSAETVRRTWLREFLARKTPPRTAAMFIASSLASGDFALRQAMEDGNKLAHELLDAGEPGGYSHRGKAVDDLLERATDARALMLALGLILAAFEAATGKNSWRSVNAATARYLRYLQVNGYELADVELRACGVKAPIADELPAGER